MRSLLKATCIICYTWQPKKKSYVVLWLFSFEHPVGEIIWINLRCKPRFSYFGIICVLLLVYQIVSSSVISYISLCMHNVVYSFKYYWHCNLAYVYFILAYFLEDISSTATLWISSINEVYVCIYLCMYVSVWRWNSSRFLSTPRSWIVQSNHPWISTNNVPKVPFNHIVSTKSYTRLLYKLIDQF